MKNKRILLLIFIFSLLLGVMEIAWFFYNYNKNVSLIFTESIIQFVLAGLCLSFFVAFLSLYNYLTDEKIKIDEPKNIEKNIKDIFQYEQLLNPPDINN
jgi:hypothetical protein